MMQQVEEPHEDLHSIGCNDNGKVQIGHQMEKLENGDELIKLLREEFSLLVPRDKPNILKSGERMDVMLIGSRALRKYYSEQDYELSELDECIYRNHFVMKQIRKRFLRGESDWDFICFNIDSMIDLLEMKRNTLKDIRINYLVKVKDFSHDSLLNDVEDNDLFLERINEIVPTEWKEISFCFKLNGDTIIEIEYCNDNHNLISQYLNSLNEKFEKVPVPFFTNSHLAPLELLEVLKRSHLGQNIEKEKWKTHLIDLSFIRMLRHFKKPFVNSPFGTVIDNQNCTDLVYYDRLIKLLVLQTLFRSVPQKSSSEIFKEISSSMASYVITKSYPYNNNREQLCNEILPTNLKLLKDVFKVKPFNRRIMYSTDDIGYYSESMDYLTQQVCALILPRFITWRDVDILDEHILFACQKICLTHHDNKILSFVVDSILEISEKVNNILNQTSILTKFFKEKEISFKLTHEQEELIDISIMEGANLCNIYLPSDIAMHILSYLSGCELHYISILNKEWYSLLSKQVVWKHICNLKNSLSEELLSRISNWKFYSIIGYDKILLPLPSNEQLCKIVNLFKHHFSNNPSAFYQFISNVFSNSFIVHHSTSFDNWYDRLDANLVIYWPDNAVTSLNLTISYDNNAEYKGCSKSNYSPPALDIEIQSGKYSLHSNSLFGINTNGLVTHFIGNYFGTEMNGKMSMCLLVSLISLSFEERWLSLITK